MCVPPWQILCVAMNSILLLDFAWTSHTSCVDAYLYNVSFFTRKYFSTETATILRTFHRRISMSTHKILKVERKWISILCRAYSSGNLLAIYNLLDFLWMSWEKVGIKSHEIILNRFSDKQIQTYSKIILKYVIEHNMRNFLNRAILGVSKHLFEICHFELFSLEFHF